MDLVKEPQLREIIDQIAQSLDVSVPAVKQAPDEPSAREAWFSEVAGMRAKVHGRILQMLAAGEPPNTDGVEVSLVQIPVSGSCGWSGCAECSAGSITAVVYRPAGAVDVPAYLHFHGGGWWVNGGVDVLRAFFGPAHIARVRELGVVVIDVDYRMAPEHKFPIPAEDCYTALTWLVDNAGDLGVDASRIAVGGGSAGGNLAAAAALLSRDRGGPELRGQVLYIPATDSSCNTRSMHLFADGYTMTRQTTMDMWEMYLASPADAYVPYASPMHAPTLEGLPPALVVVGEYDVLRDEGLAYARRLVDARVTVTLRQFPQTHGALLPENGPETERLTDEFLRANLLP